MRKYFLLGAASVLGVLSICAGTTAYKSRLIARSSNTNPTCAVATGDGDICAEDAIEAEGDIDIGDDLTVADDTVLGDDLEVGGTITMENDLTIDNATNNVLEINENSEELKLTFGTNSLSLSSGSGLDTLALGSVGLTASAPALLLQPIRFCGNGPDGGTETFLSPVPFDDTEADFISGGAGCDGEDDTTIANADEPWPILAQAAFKPVAAVCTAICTGATAANDAIVFKLYDDTVAVTGATCTTAALGGDATAAQCTWTDTSPATIAAASAITIGVDNTDDDCNDAGDDFECVVYVTF